MKWLVGILTTILLLWAGWVSNGVVQASNDRVTLQQISEDIKGINQRLDRMFR